MLRDVDLKEISDGRLYSANDLVKTDTGGCVNCGKCCHGMRETIVLDPYDVYQFQAEKHWNFACLMQSGKIELGLVDGLILPHLKMSGPDEACVFLDEAGRCSVHTCRPGFCRMYPMGRYYHDRDFSYIFQTGECVKKNLSKIRVKKWLGIANLPAYEDYIRGWHYFLRDLQEGLDERQRAEIQETGESAKTQELRSKVCMRILSVFFERGYAPGQDFYEQIRERLKSCTGLFHEQKIKIIKPM